MSADAPTIPEQLLPLSWLIGRWVGVGTGQFPTIEDFRFGQEVTFATDGRPFLIYWSQTWRLDDDGNRLEPLATETGFWRPQPNNHVEVVLAHPTGYSEIWYGQIEVTGLENARITGARTHLKSDAVLRTATAKDYSAGERLYGLVDGKLLWTFDMEAMGHGMSNHLAASLSRLDESSGAE